MLDQKQVGPGEGGGGEKGREKGLKIRRKGMAGQEFLISSLILKYIMITHCL